MKKVNIIFTRLADSGDGENPWVQCGGLGLQMTLPTGRHAP